MCHIQEVLDLDFIGKGTTYTGVWYFFPSTCSCLNYRVQIALKKQCKLVVNIKKWFDINE